MLAEVSGCIGMIHDAKKYALMYLEMEPEGMYAVEAREIIGFCRAGERCTGNVRRYRL